MQVNVKLSLRTGYVPVHLENGRIMLLSGTACPLANGDCLYGNDGYTVFGTEHPKLFLSETQKGNPFKSKTSTSVNNLDIFA